MSSIELRTPEYRCDPYETYRRLRLEAPVCRLEPEGFWLISLYRDVTAVLKDPETFSSSGLNGGIEDEPKREIDAVLNNRGMVDADPPDHGRLRGAISRAFTPKAVQALEVRIRQMTRELLATAEKGREYDFVSEFALPLPMRVLAELLGIDPALRRDFHRWARTLVTWRNGARPWTEIEADLLSMIDYFERAIAEKERHPREDLISALVQASRGAEARLNASEILGFARLLLVAGTETTTHLLGNAVVALSRNPEEKARVEADLSLVPRLVEEALRYDGPVLSLMRRVSADTEVAGKMLRAGEIVLPLLGSANRDPAKFADPEVFRLDQEGRSQGHVAFGSGIHFCLGSPLARMQAAIAFEELFAAVQWEPFIQQPSYVESFFFRGIEKLPLQISRK